MIYGVDKLIPRDERGQGYLQPPTRQYPSLYHSIYLAFAKDKIKFETFDLSNTRFSNLYEYQPTINHFPLINCQRVCWRWFNRCHWGLLNCFIFSHAIWIFFIICSYTLSRSRCRSGSVFRSTDSITWLASISFARSLYTEEEMYPPSESIIPVLPHFVQWGTC